uniref:Uncharacterized protein n=1 Tax=Rhodnius prolixus TaxID=13249 RepID=T1HST1_RHOPR
MSGICRSVCTVVVAVHRMKRLLCGAVFWIGVPCQSIDVGFFQLFRKVASPVRKYLKLKLKKKTQHEILECWDNEFLSRNLIVISLGKCSSGVR